MVYVNDKTGTDFYFSLLKNLTERDIMLIIEIAGDGQTAKGVWHSPGAETLNDPLWSPLRNL